MSETANRAQIEGWNNAVGKTWTRFQHELDIHHAPIGVKLLEAALVRPGERALDVGCGAGATTIDIAKAAGKRGHVVGVDISELLLAMAAERLAAPDAAPIEWLKADAQTHALASHAFDLVVSRFGVMFFDDPSAAFANLRLATKSSGRLVFACWRREDENPWLTLPVEAVSSLVTRTPPPPGAPGPFAFADPERVRGVLEGAGWTKVAIEPFDVALGGSPLEATTVLMTRIGPAGAALREAGATRELMAAAESAVRAALEPYATPQGVFTPSASWIVTAEA